MTIQLVILAAGQGKRMNSALPKVLHPLAGQPLLAHVLKTSFALVKDAQPIVIYGHQGERLIDVFADLDLKWVQQKEQLGTGHALLQALPLIQDNSHVLILYGDVPLITEKTLRNLIDTTPAGTMGMLTAYLTHPTGYGRIVRDYNNRVVAIVEEKDATEDERRIGEINPGIYFLPAAFLKKWLPLIKNDNAQSEYYLTSIVSFAVAENIPIHTISPEHHEEILGINTCFQLAELERFYQHSQAKKLMRHGVTLYDPARLDIRGEVEIGKDVIIDVNVILEEDVKIGDGCYIGAHSILRNATLGKRVKVNPHSIIDGGEIADDCIIGPFARIRPDTKLNKRVHIGNFVEVKKSAVGEGSKINHLSYIGDSEIGKGVNIGAGTITCNYDGINKHKTIIGDDVFIGSATQLIAPVSVGEGATVAAGSTIRQDVPPYLLTISHRLSQETIPGWQRPKKKTEKTT